MKPTYEELEQRVRELERARIERKEGTAPLREEQFFSLLVDYSSDILAFIDKDGVQTFVSKSAEKITGYTVTELQGPFSNIIHPEDLPHVQEGFNKLLENPEAVVTVNYRHKHKNGGYRHFETVGRNFLNDPSVRGVVVNIRDVTDRKQALEALLESEEKFRLISEQSLLAIGIIQDGYIKYANEMYSRMTGYSLEEIYGWEPYGYARVVYKDDLPFVMTQSRKKQAGDTDVQTHYRFRGVTKSGAIVWSDLYSKTISYHGKPADLFALIDITEKVESEEARKGLEKQLQNAQKMEAIGTLAGGIAHDFNNLLAGIQGRVSLMLMGKDAVYADFEHLKEIESYIDSATRLTRQLLAFAKGGKYEVTPTDLNGLIHDQNRMFGRTRKEISIHGAYEENLWPVEVDRGQLEQAILNLYVNAWQAMDVGGEIHVETQNVVLDAQCTRPHDVKLGKYVKLTVRDTGVGMDHEIQEKIFDPFFTTKEMGRGTGLGLASTYGIVKNHGGFIDVDSQKGHGSTFTLYLPASQKEIVPEKKPTEDLLRGSETILFVDDEDILTAFAEDLLGRLGYTVLIAGSGKEALEIYEENRDRIDMVLLDMVMPGMSGGETYDNLKSLNPHIKALLSSGYSIDGQAVAILDRGCNGFIQKPFKIKQLSQKLREILDD
jgi:two-component system, cell cycle sensor histidine kinase and response regulator CckA